MTGKQVSSARSDRQVSAGGPRNGMRFFRPDLHAAIPCILLFVFCLAMCLVSVASGTYSVSIGNVASAFLGHGDETVKMIVTEWRLPRVLLAALLGAALGLSGSVFQSLTRNPLGSPEIIGLGAGSHTGALVVMLLLSGGYYETAAGSLAGSILTAVAVYLLAFRQGIQGFRLIVVGIGVSAMLAAFNAWMIRKAELQVAMSAAIWSAGSLDGLGTEQLVPVALVLALLVPAAFMLSRPMRQLEMGQEIAQATGINVNRVRLCLIAIGVALTATVTTTAGPVAFVALVAPHLARHMTRARSATMLLATLMGSALLLLADWSAQHAFSARLPAGIMTLSIGGIYFLWLIIRNDRPL